MHSPYGEGTRDPEDRSDRTVQGTLDEFLLDGPGMLAPVADLPTPPARAVHVAAPPAPAAPRPAPGEQRSIDAFESGALHGRQELEARAPRAAAGLMLEREVERVAMREAASGITRDELVIGIAREVRLPLEDLRLVDSYVSDLLLEGKLRLVGERILLAPDVGEGPRGQTGPAAPPGASRRARSVREARPGKGTGRRGRAAKGPRGPRKARTQEVPASDRRRRRGKEGGRT